MKDKSKTTLILSGLCAALWTLRVVVDLFAAGNSEPAYYLLINALCAGAWIASFVIRLKRYRTEKKSEASSAPQDSSSAEGE